MNIAISRNRNYLDDIHDDLERSLGFIYRASNKCKEWMSIVYKEGNESVRASFGIVRIKGIKITMETCEMEVEYMPLSNCLQCINGTSEDDNEGIHIYESMQRFRDRWVRYMISTKDLEDRIREEIIKQDKTGDLEERHRRTDEAIQAAKQDIANIIARNI